jgi:CRP-like cAMP-binding protein
MSLKGEVLMREGEPGDDFFVLVEGAAEVRESKQRVALLGRGDFAGEMTLLTNTPRMATVRATSPLSALRATRRGFSARLETSPRIQRKISRRLRTASRRPLYSAHSD